MTSGKNVVGQRPYIYLIDEVEGTDIDNPIDFDFAEFVYQEAAEGGAKYSNYTAKLPQTVEILAKSDKLPGYREKLTNKQRKKL